MAIVSSDRPAWTDWALAALGAFLGFGWLILGQKIGETIEVESLGGAMALYYVLVFVPLLGIAALFAWISGVRFLRAGEAPALWLGLGLLFGAVGLGMSAAYSWLNGGLVPGPLPSAPVAMLALGAALTLLQVGTEELFFRGWMQPALGARSNGLVAVLLTALVFAAFHVPAGLTSPVSVVTLLLGGILFGLLALRSGGVLAPLGAHFAWNMIEDQGLGLVPNPGSGTLGSYVDLDLLGSALWGGHEEGLNASIGTVIVLVALILPLLRGRTPKDAPVAAAT